MKPRNFVNPGSPTARDRHIHGVHAVTAWLRFHPDRVTQVHYDPHSASRLAPLIELADGAAVSLDRCSEQRLTMLAGTSRHQGVVATSLPFPYVELNSVLGAAPRLLVLADQLQDPHNLGALLRTAAAADAGALILPKDGSVPVTATVETAAAGAAAQLPVCRVTNASRTLQTLKRQQYWIVGLMPRDGLHLYDFEPPNRVVLVIGGETGMRPLVAKHCDFNVSIPMSGGTESLNASVAAGIVMYEVRRRWSDLPANRPNRHEAP